ncbi:MAG: DUF2322 family protein [Zoogloeaceae bacterium]|jgi:hypothetical protein|nr:DUF2322 family protein [Zoogloeaceae bacterium]
MNFAETLKKLPGVSHLAALRLLNRAGAEIGMIPHQAGSVGSLAVYNHLAQIYGAITPEAARHGLELYAEHSEDARQNPGKHPNIDRLLALAALSGEEGRAAALKVKAIFAASRALE